MICKIIHLLNFYNHNRLSIRDRFEIALLFKSFNRLNSDEKQKTLKNLLLTLKNNGLVFVYESVWTKDDSKKISFENNKKKERIQTISHRRKSLQ